MVDLSERFTILGRKVDILPYYYYRVIITKTLLYYNIFN